MSHYKVSDILAIDENFSQDMDEKHQSFICIQDNSRISVSEFDLQSFLPNLHNHGSAIADSFFSTLSSKGLELLTVASPVRETPGSFRTFDLQHEISKASWGSTIKLPASKVVVSKPLLLDKKVTIKGQAGSSLVLNSALYILVEPSDQDYCQSTTGTLTKLKARVSVQQVVGNLIIRRSFYLEFKVEL